MPPDLASLSEAAEASLWGPSDKAALQHPSVAAHDASDSLERVERVERHELPKRSTSVQFSLIPKSSQVT